MAKAPPIVVDVDVVIRHHRYVFDPRFTPTPTTTRKKARMTKKQQIAELKKALAETHTANREKAYEIARLKDEVRLVEQSAEEERVARVRRAEEQVQRDRAARKREQEQETLKHIRAGMVPIEVLRGTILQDYSASENREPGSKRTEMTLSLRHGQPVEKALFDAIVDKGAQAGGIVTVPLNYKGPTLSDILRSHRYAA